MGSWRERVMGSGSYELTAYTGYDSQGKKLPRKTRTIKVTGMSGKRLEKHLDVKAEEFQKEIDEGLYLDSSKITFAEYSQRWLDEHPKKNPRLIARNEECLQRINAAIGHIRLVKLRVEHLDELYKNLKEKGVRRDGSYKLSPQLYKRVKADKPAIAVNASVCVRTLNKLLNGTSTTLNTATKIAAALDSTVSKAFKMEGEQTGLHPNTILKHHRLIHAILEKACKKKLITANVAKQADAPAGVYVNAPYYDDEQVKQLLESLASAETKYQVAVYLGLFGGLRVGECCGLEWSDIDFDRNSLTVNRSRQQIPGLPAYDKEPKSERSKRTFTLPEIAISLLRRHRKEQLETRLRLGSQWEHNDKVLTQWNGEPMNPQTPSHFLNKWLRANNLPHITFHGLRHTHISLLIANGADIATVSNRAGHNKISTTLDNYTHILKSRDTAAADMLDDIMGSMFSPKQRRRHIDDIATNKRTF